MVVAETYELHWAEGEYQGLGRVIAGQPTVKANETFDEECVNQIEENDTVLSNRDKKSHGWDLGPIDSGRTGPESPFENDFSGVVTRIRGLKKKKGKPGVVIDPKKVNTKLYPDAYPLSKAGYHSTPNPNPNPNPN
jgi:hypothetical protein